jgi:hypothetical protein
MLKLNPNQVITHEYGHYVDNVNATGKFTLASDDLSTLINKKIPDRDDLRFAKDRLKKQAGDYIGSTNAETFAEFYRLNKHGNLPEEWKFVGEFLDGLKNQ